MNRKQFRLMWALALVVVLMVTFPPWRGYAYSIKRNVAGSYYPVWSVSFVAFGPRQGDGKGEPLFRTGIDLYRLGAQLFGLGALGTALMITFGRR